MILDFHSHWGTRRGYPFRTEAELAHQARVWKQAASYVTEEEMAAYFRGADVRAMLDLGYTKYLDLDEVAPLHDYALETRRAHPDALMGLWLQIHPRHGAAGVAEFRRCLDEAGSGSGRPLVGLCVSGAAVGRPASDPAFEPYLRLSIEAGAPVLILVGYTALGAGLPGGNGVVLDLCHPRYLDEVAARHPELTIVAGRPAWPWQDDMIAVLLHKPNVWYELHGWSPKYFTDSLKREISGRLRERILFGADYPVLRYERLVADWRAEGYDEAVLQGVFHANGAVLLERLGLS